MKITKALLKNHRSLPSFTRLNLSNKLPAQRKSRSWRSCLVSENSSWLLLLPSKNEFRRFTPGELGALFTVPRVAYLSVTYSLINPYLPSPKTSKSLKPLSVKNSSNVSLKPAKLFFLSPRNPVGLVLTTNSLFAGYKLFIQHFRKLPLKFLLKKRLFSFLFPNQVKKSIMNRKRRVVVHRYISAFRRRLKSRPHFSHDFFRRNLKNFSRSLKIQQNFASRDVFGDKNSCHAYEPSYALSRGEIVDQGSLLNRGPDYTFKRKEVRIPRVRFKPGYQRIWRRARSALQENLGLKLCYQRRMTRYLSKFTRQTTFYSFSTSEMSVGRMFVYSRLLPDMGTVAAFCETKSLYLNGRSTAALQLTAVPNDLIQLLVSLQYYVAHRWLSNSTLKRNRRFRRLVYRKGLASRHKLMKTRKQLSQHTPS